MAVCVLVLIAAGCASPVGVRTVDARHVHRILTGNVLTRGEPSVSSARILNLLDLAGVYGRDPEQALAALHERFRENGSNNVLFALAELSFHTAERRDDRERYLAAAIYAYAFLFPEDPTRAPGPYDSRLRLAMDLYNLGMTSGLESDDGAKIVVDPATLALPFGELVIHADASDRKWGRYELTNFVAAARLEVRGLRNRHRRRGIGAPLAGTTVVRDASDRSRASSRFVPEGTKAAATAVLRIPAPWQAIGDGFVEAWLELYTIDAADSVEIAGHTVPLESEVSSTFAYNLDQADVWSFGLRGFRSGDFRVYDEGLIMIHPHRRGRIPVVLVHGTASNPATFAETMNELLNARPLRGRFQYWLFIYNTGSPILYSAATLRETLSDAVETLDPDGEDPMLRRMVLVGHSQGGLVAKLVTVESGDHFWEMISDTPIDQLELREKDRELLQSVIFFEPLPFVERVVFLATPHRGSFLAERRLARFASSLVEFPSDLAEFAADLVEQNPDVLRRSRLATSIENMQPGHPFLETLAAVPVSDSISAHSILAVQTPGPVEEGHDGVMTYASGHLEGVASEFVVESGHSLQNDPIAILELVRILREHRDRVDAGPRPAPVARQPHTSP